MQRVEPRVPSGFRDFSPEESRRRHWLFTQLRQVFELFGYDPIETPAVELLEILLGKYGEEAEKLVFRILNSGDFLKDVPEEIRQTNDYKKWLKHISDKGLRYDLTVPLARYVAQNRGKITLPFKRYQIQPVWRAERPQKGRFREFVQCDADVIGSYDPYYDFEMVLLLDEGFRKIGLGDHRKILINDRRLLQEVFKTFGIEGDGFRKATGIIDKLDKVGIDKVKQLLESEGFSADQIANIEQWLGFKDPEEARKYINDDEAIKPIITLLKQIKDPGITNVEWTPSLVRGLDYYTGTIYEVVLEGAPVGSVSGGGRYDNLTELFGVPNMPGIGISFGADRILTAMEMLKIEPWDTYHTNKVMVILATDKVSWKTLNSVVADIRAQNIPVEILPQKKMKKAFKTANNKNVRITIIIGDREVETAEWGVKDMQTGKQESIPVEKVAETVLNMLS
ncbi:MAG: histidine--tRNA ligase [Chlorobi bacterium]|nr:histidine--tRNA ligase [Chlorobiota bacterium]